MKSLMAFILGGLVIGLAVYWYTTNQRSPDPSAAPARNDTSAPRETDRNIFNAEAIQEELARTGQVIREKSRQAGNVISDAAANAKITAEIKTKLLKASNLPALAIDVDTTDGVVTLSGAVSSHEQIARAIQLALDTDGVERVVSSLQVKARTPE